MNSIRPAESLYLVTLCFAVAWALVNSGCNHGLSPALVATTLASGFGGTIYYRGEWPDNVGQNKLVASKVYRRFHDINEILSLVLTTDSIRVFPSASLSDNLPTNVDSSSYKFHLQPAEYRYVAVVQAHGDPLDFANWKIVGVYGDSVNGFPRTVDVGQDQIVNGIDLVVDFDHPPPQPFDTTSVQR